MNNFILTYKNAVETSFGAGSEHMLGLDLLGQFWLLTLDSRTWSFIFALGVVINKNPIHSVLCLIGLFFSISIFLIQSGLHFIGLSYLLVYVGAISILFLFTLMLINIRISELLTEERNSTILALVATISISLTITNIMPDFTYGLDMLSDVFLSITNIINPDLLANNNTGLESSIYDSVSSSTIANVSSVIWDSSLWESSHISSIGMLLYSSYFISLIVISLVLLLSMVGTISITVRKKFFSVKIEKPKKRSLN